MTKPTNCCRTNIATHGKFNSICSKMNRRSFLKGSGAICAMGFLPPVNFSINCSSQITIAEVASAVEREPLKSSFGFKGGYLSELWQIASCLKSDSGYHSIGLGTQSVLWSDARIFAAHSEPEGNQLMYTLTRRALQMIKGETFSSPIEMIENIYPELYDIGKKITGNPNLRKTFALNALVSIDNSLWLLYAKGNGITTFDQLIPDMYKPTFSEKHERIAAIPLISYNTTPAQLKETVDAGYFFLKIKIGQQGTQSEMLQKDMARLTEIHNILKDSQTSHTENRKLSYYIDANGRYESKETFLRLLDHAQKIGAFGQIAIVEEPFPEEMDWDVSDIPVRLAADETAHTDHDTLQRIQMGYRAIALKPIAKTLSMTMKIAKAATDNNIPCFCADLTVNPVLVEWNKNVAARLKPFPGIGNLGLLESNGSQNYKNWNKMQSYLPASDEPWVKVDAGLHQTRTKYFETGGGIFDELPHYENLFKQN